ncbi:HNH endonuclease [Pseudorhodoferax soli]|uniref:Uncharacterized protein DUF3298 n=1 Tax=Pseudorhodoferax soli TaxID=545864 RepID=A0A368XVF5_9BURK|nr:HNH endonuclease [Pseudorhodoferax soli]RCW70507.1 uncharacterized protein DUF3298 [Pseudorhodoferax soli]
MSLRSRPQIPAAVRRAVLVEAGHRCAIPRCGHADVDIHHITPWEACEKHEYGNLIALCPNCHRRAHKGEIDRKALHLYKAALVAAFQTSGEVSFSAPPVEIKRRIYEVDPSSAECFFSFEFPDLMNPADLIVSKNIEAWGLELLEEFRHSQDAEHRGSRNRSEYPIGWLNGTYEVCRRDLKVISVRYDLEMMAFGAAHRFYETRVQNFFVTPFAPIVLEELLASPKALPMLAEAVNARLFSAGLDPIAVETDAASGAEFLSRFVIDRYGLTFIFDPYIVAAYAAGKQYVHFTFGELFEMFEPEKLEALIPPDS